MFHFAPPQYIGSLDVARPSSRVEIVAAMRRIRVSRNWAKLHSEPLCFVVLAVLENKYSLLDVV